MPASGSVQDTIKMSPVALLASALRVRSTGSGHLRPRKSKVFSALGVVGKGRKVGALSLS